MQSPRFITLGRKNETTITININNIGCLYEAKGGGTYITMNYGKESPKVYLVTDEYIDIVSCLDRIK